MSILYEILHALDLPKPVLDKICLGMQRGQILNYQKTFVCARDKIRLESSTLVEILTEQKFFSEIKSHKLLLNVAIEHLISSQIGH